MKRWQTVAKFTFALVSIALLLLFGGGIDAAHAAFWGRSRPADTQATIKTTGKIAEASPPLVLQELRQVLDKHQPQVTILSPRKSEVLADNTVSVRFLVNDLPLFKNETFGLGPHLHVLLDNRAYQAVYDTSQPLVFSDLEPGTHTIRAFASRPWHESFKNDGAFAQTTFHVFTKTQDNSPNPELPLLTYSRPQGTYGAEPILLDFYLTNAPLHLIAQADAADEIADWRIRCTVNGDSFVIDRWQPLYLKGFKPGKNWVQLEYLDDNGNPVPNVFNNTVRVVNYQPNGDDTLSKLVRGELSATDVRGIVDPNYVPPAPEPSPEPAIEAPIVEPTPVPTIAPTAQPSPPVEIPRIEIPQTKATPSLEAPERPASSAPLPAIPVPSVPPSPEPTPKPTPEALPSTPDASPSLPEPTIPSAPATGADARGLPKTPDAAETPPSAPTNPPASPEAATPDTLSETLPERLSGSKRLRQLGQRLGQYRSPRPTIAPLIETPPEKVPAVNPSDPAPAQPDFTTDGTVPE